MLSNNNKIKSNNNVNEKQLSETFGGEIKLFENIKRGLKNILGGN